MMKRYKSFFRLLGVLVVLGMQACTSITKVEAGDQAAGDLRFTANAGWNKISLKFGPAEQWSREGIFIDRLTIYSGVENDQTIHPLVNGDKSKPIKFSSQMKADQLVAMFEQLYRRDGSDFTLQKTEQADFAGKKAVRFEYQVIRKQANVRLLGLGYAVVENGKLYSMLYQAPRLTFFSREKQAVEQMMATAKLK
jgi:hypothetical protein